MTHGAFAGPSLEDIRRHQDHPETAPSGAYILVVDDEDAVRDFLTRALESAGYVVRQASGAAAALEIMRLEPAALVLCDVQMPGEDGLWLAERLRARWPQTPVVMITTIDDLFTVQRARDLGVVDFLIKPVKLEHLIGVVQRVTTARQEGSAGEAPAGSPAHVPAASVAPPPPADHQVEAEYTLESPVRCPACGERITTLKAVRLIRAHVNFTSTLPRRGRVLACPYCLAVVPAELTNF